MDRDDIGAHEYSFAKKLRRIHDYFFHRLLCFCFVGLDFSFGFCLFLFFVFFFFMFRFAFLDKAFVHIFLDATQLKKPPVVHASNLCRV